ncbi:MAG: HTH domain-containing protein [Akkermansia sp.]|nr:HTH domain-containing protein [Akkermansia sp.]
MKQGDVIAVLKEAGKPLSAREILELLRARGMEAPGGNTPQKSVEAFLYMDRKRNGESSPFGKVDRKGLFFINPNYHAPQAGEKKHVAKPGKTAASPAPVVGKTADSILDKQGNRKTRGKGKVGKPAKAHQKGYVYILTNPSFREDWVKIGRSARPVDVRSKELDNTAVPLPFEIYATMETVMFN